MSSASLARLLAHAALRRPLALLAAGLAITITGLVLASHLALQTDISELLPGRAPSVVALHKLSKRLGGTGSVAIAVESIDGKPAALRAYIPRLAGELRDQLGPDLLSIRYQRKEVTDYFTKYAVYYVGLADLTRWADQLAVAVSKQNPAYVELDDQAATPEQSIKDVANEIRAKEKKLGGRIGGTGDDAQEADPETGLLMTEGGKLAVLFVRPAASSLELASGEGMLRRIQAVVAATAPERAGVRILGYTGSIPVALTEVAAIRHDIASTALLVALGVLIVVGLFFRGVRELALMTSAVIVGIAVALGFAMLWIGHVNAQTAFLGSIIMGTGINYGIIFLDRYRQARAASPDLPAALEDAIGQTLRATWIAAAATAISFGVLAAGEVESFHQFGWIGGIGILACWVATFTIVPACIVLADRRRKPRALPRWQPLRAACLAVARACERAPRVVVAAIGLAVIASAALAVSARHHAIETNLRKLGTRSADTTGIEKLDSRLRKMDDRSSSPAVVATEDRADAAAVCDELNARAKTDLAGTMQRCYSINDILPRDLDRRAAVLARLQHDLELVDEADLSAEDRDQLAQLRRALAEAPPTDTDLPPTLREYFVERDGSVGKLAYVEPKDEHIEANLYKLTDAFREFRLPSGRVIESSGELVVFADVLRAMRRDATKLTLAAAVLVLLVLALVTRHLGSFARVAAALVAGVAVMLGVAVVLGEKLNFFNFVALPTTFGIGIDYAINIEERIRQRGRGALAEAVAESAPAVLLASTTSIIGYASLLIADSRALSSFGALAIIGELACVVVAVLLVPALWALLKAQNAPGSSNS